VVFMRGLCTESMGGRVSSSTTMSFNHAIYNSITIINEDPTLRDLPSGWLAASLAR
jgi:hypothetical protein